MKRGPEWRPWLVALALLVGCGDLTDSVGEQGRLRFILSTAYELPEDELTDAVIVAGHTQHLDVELTTKGDDEIDEPDQIAYRLEPGAGTELDPRPSGELDAPDLDLTVSKAGTYTLDAVYKGKIVDSIDLTFDSPDNLELSLELRKPYGKGFEKLAGASPIAVVEGSQVTFLPIPRKGKRRLAGEITTEVSATPKELVVPGAGASLVYEQDVWSVEGNVDFYFIDPGTVTITVADPVSKAEGSFTFEVADAP